MPAPLSNDALWNALSDANKHTFTEHAWRMAEYHDRDYPPGQDNATKPYMDAIKAFCGVRTGDASLGSIISAADTFKHVPQHAGTLYDTLPENIRRANAIFHAANTEAKQYVLPSDVFLMQDPAHARRSETGLNLMDVKTQLLAFKADQGTASQHILGALVVRNAVQHMVDALEEMTKLTQPGPPAVTLAMLDRRVLAGYCNTLQKPEIAKEHPALAAPVAAFAELLALQEQQQHVLAEKSKKAFYR